MPWLSPRPRLHRLPPGGRRVPRRARRQQRASLVPAAQGRIRPIAEGAARGALRRGRRPVPDSWDPAPGGPGEIAVPDLPRRALREGQVAVQDEHRGELPVGRALKPRIQTADRTRRTSTRAGGYFHLSPGEIFRRRGYWHPEKPWLDSFRRRVLDEPAELRAIPRREALSRLRSAISVATATSCSGSVGFPARSSGGRDLS